MKKVFLSTLTLALVMSGLLMTSCKKEKTTEPEPTVEEPTKLDTTSYYFQGEIDGTVVTFAQAVNGFYSGGNDSGVPGTGGSYIADQGSLMMNPTTKVQFGYEIVKKFASTPTNLQIYNMFGIQSYGYTDKDHTIDGAEIGYADEAGNYWSTTNGTGSQTGSTFKITECTSYTIQYPFNAIVKVKFSCKLYDSKGNSKTVKNGTLRGYGVIYP
ncbi:MAG TPA: hypothetical protein VFF27_11630 [Bacteroidia bacterium]|jgi:hypothetical protein|nr:hypothetical protein [Bacteroidia bacterium]